MRMFVLDHLWLIPALPLLGATLNWAFGKPHPTRAVNAIAIGSTGLSFALVLEMLREIAAAAPALPHVKSYFTWIAAGPFRADFALQVDQLTLVMLLVVTGVGWLIHIYATGYMAHERGYGRFFAYLNLFMFFMLILVMGANYLLMFVGWEGVGLCSYLLIGFYFLRKSASDAGKKAFIVNRIGDFGFMLGMFLIFWTFGSLDYNAVFPQLAGVAPETQAGVLTAIALLLFTGAVGKSAQLPLYVWLPDAMEGPTPVSALIHAATMVTAGVYMIARSSAIFTHAPMAMTVVAVIGALTALFAATIGLVQTDIKRVLAYSTVSQLGYMVLAMGVGAFTAGIFHLMTHAFFKALLFLAAGSVIHAMAGEQDMRRMGGLRKKIPITYWTMLIATLAIGGVPGLSGFFSKDAILLHTFAAPHGDKILWGMGILTALLTAFYMFRLIFLTFFGAPRYDEHAVHVHESPRVMTVPLMTLAVFSALGGLVGIPAALGGSDWLHHYLSHVFGGESLHVDHATEYALMGVAVLAAAIGIFAAWRMYIARPQSADSLAQTFHAPYRLLLNKYYVDELYDRAVVQPLKWLSTRVLWQAIDARAIDGAVNGLADVAAGAGDRMRYAHSGNTRSYAAWVVTGAVLVIAFLLWQM